MMGRHTKVPLTIEYRLPVTVVRFSGVRTSTTISYREAGEQPPPAITKAVIVEVRADPRAQRTITVPDVDREDLKVAFKLLDDGRLVSSDTTADPHNDAAWSAAVKNAALFGAAGAALGPWGAVGGALIGGIGTAVISSGPRFEEFVSGDARQFVGGVAAPASGKKVSAAELFPNGKATPGVMPEDVGVEPAYAHQQEDEAELLVAYRVALGRLRQAHATVALAGGAGLASALEELEKSFDSTQRIAQVSEDRYAKWLADQVTVTKEVVEIQHYLDELPTEAELRHESTEGMLQHRDKLWWPSVDKLEITVTCDLATPLPAAAAASGQAAPDQVCYRPPQPAVLKTWQLRRDPVNYGRWLAPELIECKWALVTLPRFEKRMTAPMAADAKSTVNLGFSESGALTSVSSDVMGPGAQRIAALGDLSTSLSTAVTAGKSLGETFAPSAIEAAQLKREVDIADARKKLAPAMQDPLAEKRNELAEADLDAQIAVAHFLVTDPSRVVLVAPSTHTSS
jgi:hypothetical protein